jgi:hypothetical protein
MKAPRRQKKLVSGLEQMTPLHRSVSKSMLRDLEKATEIPVSEWHGKCFQMACALVKHEIANGDPVYGHWLGPVDPTGYWKDTAQLPFHQHGWIIVPDKTGTIIDPTRFSFENVEPYIYIGSSDFYDEGGNGWRASVQRPCPAYVPPEGAKPYQATRDISALPPATLDFVLGLMGQPEGVTTEMLFWLANLVPARLGDHQDAIYEFLIGPIDLQAAIPIDNFRAWERRKKRA